MANLSTAEVSLATGAANLAGDVFWLEKKGYYVQRLKLVFTAAHGGLTNLITAASLGFNRLIDCSHAFNITDGTIIPAVVDPTTNNIYLSGTSGSNAVGDVVSGKTLYITVIGS